MSARKSNEIETPAELQKKGSLTTISPDGKNEEVEVGEETSGEGEEISSENRQGLLKVLSKAVGFDITTITLPVTVNEPASFLMRLCEQLQSSDLLDKAAECEDSIERLSYVAVFACTLYAVAERTAKPFNPILGETYEYLNPERNNFKFCAEQVSHHPPMAACYAESDTWKFWEAQRLKTKFTGNSLEANVEGSNNVFIKGTNEHFKWVAVKTVVHNIIMGRLWIDHYGEFEVVNKSTGEKAKIRMKECGWFSKNWHELDGHVLDANGKECIQLVGKWNESIFAKALNGYVPQLNSSAEDSPDIDVMSPSKTKKDAKKEKKEKKNALRKEKKDFKKALRKNADEPLWTLPYKPIEKPENRFLSDWTPHSLEMTKVDAKMKAHLPPTDSRLRADRAALEVADTKTAAAEKHIIEERQREERRKREKENKEWTPKWFKLSKDSDGQDFWEFTGTYFEERDKRINA